MTVRPGFVRFGDIESAMASMHGVDEKGLSALRSALANLRNIGLPVARSADGRPGVTYRFEDAWMWAVAFELLQMGCAPHVAVQIVVAIGGPVEKEIERLARAGGEERYLALWPNVVADRIAADRGELGQIGFNILSAAAVAKTQARDGLGLKGSRRRAVLINLTGLYHELVSGLQASLEGDRVVVDFAPAAPVEGRKTAAGGR